MTAADEKLIEQLQKKVTATREELDRYEAALRALGGKPPARNGAGGDGRRGGKRVPGRIREQQGLDALRQKPRQQFDAKTMAREAGMPITSAHRVVRKLAADKKATVVGETDGGVPIICHKTTTVRPGEPVNG